jgi:hypothetical protein
MTNGKATAVLWLVKAEDVVLIANGAAIVCGVDAVPKTR